ncbi:hypothetical protein NDU88_001259 [Pleurodeles waltl]|uniref:Uncharacterized protein n=1 Tax=Pleurodeles waltl TaxID=8319 RepID=A0AAV7KPX0_PLEWA|nr:hypothetical protein NDU88_001259 [Pleurodeles waltl]
MQYDPHRTRQLKQRRRVRSDCLVGKDPCCGMGPGESDRFTLERQVAKTGGVWLGAGALPESVQTGHGVQPELLEETRAEGAALPARTGEVARPFSNK